MSALTQFFTLSGAKDLAEKLKPEARSDIEHALRLARQKVQAAEALWSNGSVAEALRLAAQGLTLVTDALAASDPDRGFGFELVRELLLSGGLSPRRVDAIEKAFEHRKTWKLPALDEDAPADAADVFRRWIDAAEQIHRTFEPSLMTRTQQVALRAFRAVVALLGVGAIVAVLAYFTLRTPEDEVQASGFFDSHNNYVPGKAMDRNEGTWWIGPDNASAWIEVQLGSARRVRQVRLLNSSSPPWNDRGTKDYSLEIYGNGRLLRTIRASFAETQRPSWVSHQVGLDNVERVRFVARSWFHKGAALAEIRID